jgi:hypothetical protein
MSMATIPNNLTWADMKRMAMHATARDGEWGGAPMLCDHARLVMEPRYPYKGFHGAGGLKREPCDITDDVIINSWNCPERGGDVLIWRENGKLQWGIYHQGPMQRFQFWFDTFACAAQEIWSIETEVRAMEKLKSLVTAQAFKCYMLSGMFIETSKRSGVSYLFRKLRPTIAMRPNKSGMMRVLTTLCLHPLGYYENTWAGVMTPTDDVIAHCVLMRGDERKYWAKANHHSVWSASSGI